jgi:hypothetical protein
VARYLNLRQKDVTALLDELATELQAQTGI